MGKGGPIIIAPVLLHGIQHPVLVACVASN